jgi:hypothetical protein
MGRAAIGRGMVELLGKNDLSLVELRAELMEQGLFPPA